MFGTRLDKCLGFMIVGLAVGFVSVARVSAQSDKSVRDFYQGKQLRSLLAIPRVVRLIM